MCHKRPSGSLNQSTRRCGGLWRGEGFISLKVMLSQEDAAAAVVRVRPGRQGCSARAVQGDRPRAGADEKEAEAAWQP